MIIQIETTVQAPLTKVWDAWINPDHIPQWNFASPDWCCPFAEVNFIVGGKFKSRMEAKDGSIGFDFEGTYTKIVPQQSIHFSLEDDRIVTVEFTETPNGVKVIEAFDAEDEHSAEQQKQGWQSILNNFKAHVEGQ